MTNGSKPTPKKSGNIEPKVAVNNAYTYLVTASPSPSRFSNFRLEEFTEDNGNFKVTLSYDEQGDFSFDRTRVYKDFLIDKKTGIVLSMKIRKV